MKPNQIKLAALFMSMLFTVALQAQAQYQLDQYKMTISGTSSLHDWVSEVTAMDITTNLSLGTSNQIMISNLQVAIPVKKIISEKGKIMDKKTHKALMEEEHPKLKYSLQKIISQEGKQLIARGQLEIAGTKRAIDLKVKTSMEKDKITFTGKKDLKMTDFGIDPPTALMGTLKTGDDIVISFEVTLVPLSSPDKTKE